MKNYTTTAVDAKNLISQDKLHSALADIEKAYQEYLRELEELQKEKQKSVQKNNPTS